MIIYFTLILLVRSFCSANEDIYKVLVEEWPVCDTTFLNGTYTIEHKIYCDRFFACNNGIPYLMQCEDGFAYTPFKGCKILHEVDCTNRSKLQVPRGSGHCPRLYGLYEDPTGCGKYYTCYNGTATPGKCPEGLIFDNKDKVCRTPTYDDKQKCLPPPVLLGCTIGPDGSNKGGCTWFQCPALNNLPFGDHSRHPYPGHCRYFVMCLHDNTIKIGACASGSAFNQITGYCDYESNHNYCVTQSTSTTTAPTVTLPPSTLPPQPLQPVQPQPVQPIQTQPAQPIQPQPVVQPIQPQPLQPIQPQPVQPIQPQPVQPLQPQPVQPIQPQPVQPVQPQPVQPIQPQPVQQLQVELVQPIQPPPVQPIQLQPVQQPYLTE